jgi:hypothetical protein
MQRPTLWHVPILAGLLLGVVLGLIYTWLIAPVQFYDTAPDRLRPDLKEAYILLICEAFAADGDWPTARRRLDGLGDPNIADTILELAERAIEEGQPVSTVRHLAAVATELGAENPALAFFMPTRPVTPSPPPPTLLATFTPTQPPAPTATATPPPTSMPTLTPEPTPTPGWRFELLAQQQICDPDRPQPAIQVIVRDADGEDISGVEAMISWDGRESTIITGFKPELGVGYADLIIEPEVSYAVHLADGSEEVSGIRTSSCTSRDGLRLLSTRLIFQEISSVP